MKDAINKQLDNPEEAELAAALAAVLAFMETDEAASDEMSSDLYGSWGLAARLESCAGAAVRLVRPLPASSRQNPWTLAAQKFIPALLALALCSSSVWLPAQAEPGLSSVQTAKASTIVSPAESILNACGDPGKTPDSSTSGPAARQPNPIRVALVVGASRIAVDLPDGAELRDPDTGSLIATLPPQSRCCFSDSARLAIVWTVQGCESAPPSAGPTEAGVVTRAGSSALTSSAAYLLKPSGQDALFGLSGKLFRGVLTIRKSARSAVGINAINVLDLEEYLYSVIPSEMPSAWPIEALKAQAVAARSYAVANLGKHDDDGYDLKSTAEDQIYSGVAAENEATNKAVAETDGLVLKHDGRVIPAFFHSTSGGYTEVAEFVWGRPVSFLKSVPDYDDNSPFFTWSQKVSVPVIEEALRKSYCDVGSLLGLYVVSRAPSMRARHVLVVGSDKVKIMSGEELRRILSLPSSNFNLGCDQQSYLIAGRGFGHGLGLSQWGARALAENGYNAAQILTYYYRDVSLEYL